jgi:hypothetical protein
LPSNGSPCHIAPPLRLFVPKSLQVNSHFFFSEGCAYNVCDQSCLPSLWLISHSDHSPTALTAPALRPLIQRGSLKRCEPVQVYHHHHHLFRWCG